MEIISRNRINMLMQKAAQHSVVMLTAGHGYGKTEMLKSFLAQAGYRSVWVSLSPFDQELSHFWDTIRLAFRTPFPDFYEEIPSEFPMSAASVNGFIRLFTGLLYSGERFIWVVDDYDRVSQPTVDQFFKRFIELELENFCLILVTAEKTGLGRSAYWHKELYYIGSEELAFRPSEVKLCFEAQGHRLSVDKLNAIMELTDGWPLALSLIADNMGADASGSALGLTELDKLFEESFSIYSPEVQRLFIQLSLLSTFTVDVIRMLGEFEPVPFSVF